MSLHETLNKIRSAPIPNNEVAAKHQIVAPVLECLGWDPFDVLFEHPVGGKGGGKVDLALRGPDRIVALIEAKAPGIALQSNVDQIVGYAFREGADICALTTGVEWWLYLPMERYRFEERRFAVLKLQQDPVEQLAEDLRAFLSKDNLVQGKAEEQAKLVLQWQREAKHLETEIPKVWKQMVDRPADDLVDLLARHVYKEIGIRPAPEQVAAVLLGSRVPPAPKPGSSPGSGTNEPNETPPNLEMVAHVDDASGKRARVFELWGHRYEVANWSQLLVGVADILHERHGACFERILDATAGRSKQPVATRNPDAGGGLTPVGSSGIYIKTRGTAKTNLWRVHAYLEVLGHPTTDIRILCEDAGTQVVSPGRRASTKPRGFMLWGHRHRSSTWQELLVLVAEAIYRRHNTEFLRILDLRGRIHPHASRSPDDLRRPKAVGSSGIYIETNLSAKDIRKRARQFLEHLGHSPSDLEIVYD